ncbi:MAG: enoyl-[acyl-carrier-protein] reductase FabL [Anaerolineales bacterium]|nr:enoyl-[acyl-carrier-protein] reductase FabL [Anaerolineales bacterium]MCK5635596.1 enoyl-[acyl-carrier-protein] reductase FabL [Anaerolineales bacterium]
MRFTDKVALVTGSGRGIGRVIALHLAAEGADIVVNFFRNRAPAEDTAEEIRNLGRKAVVIKANVGDLDDLENLFSGVEETFGGLDIFISNAASGYNRPVLEQKPRGWEWTMNINARALLFGAQHATRLMQDRGGAIVSISSPGASHVIPDYVVVGTSKAAIESLTRYLAVELAPLGIRVNAVSPGVVRTDALEHFDAAQDDSVIKRVSKITPAGRLVTPEDVADLVAFLCSQEACMIRGQTIVIDGGFILLGDQSSR